jgi:ATP-dependent helicase/nuclease subunit B
VDAFVAQLAELCRTTRTGVKWVIVPSHALGWTLGERLVLASGAWANLRFTPPLDLALRMAAPFLVERGIEPATDRVGPALVMRLLLDLPANVPRYFRGLAEQPAMAEALWRTLGELRMAGLASGDLRAEAFDTPAKHRELRALMEGYERYLAEHRLADRAAVFAEALEHLDVGPVLPRDVMIELPGVVRPPLERRLLDALPARRMTPETLAVPGLPRPRRLRALVNSQVPPVGSDASRLAFIMAPGALPDAGEGRDGTLTLFQAGGHEAEVEEVFRRILAARVPLDQVEIACAGDEHAPLVWEKAQRHGWPVTIGPGLSIRRTRPARALLAFCAWVEEGFPAGALRRLLQSGDLRLDLDGGPTAGQAARLLGRSGATWGRETYGVALAQLAASARDRADDPELETAVRSHYAERAEHCARLATWIGRLVALAPEPDGDGQVGVGDVVGGCRRFVKDFAAKSSELDGEATGALDDVLDSLGALATLTRPQREVLAHVRHQVASLTVGGDRARPGHLFVTPLRQAGYAGRPQTFVVGLEEGRVFPALLEDSVLLDAEREAISEALPTSRDRATEALHAVVGRLASLEGRVCLSFSCRDLRQHRETFPSWLVLQAYRVLKPGQEWSYRDLGQALGEPASLVPRIHSDALGDAGWWLAHLRGVGRTGLPAVHAAFPWLEQGERAERARDSEIFTPWDGLVPEAAALLDPRVSGRAVSATALEGLARCPFRHFLERGLGIEAIDDAVPDRDRWLDGATRGSLLHDLYAVILRELRERGERPDPRRHAGRLRELAEVRLREMRRLIPPPSAGVFQRERQEMLADLDLFLTLEHAERGRTPVGFEVAFGSRVAEGEPLAQAEPVLIDLGGGVRFALVGRIDRIDRLDGGAYEVLDYKTGGYFEDQYSGTFRGGRLLQHALYALAATTLLRRTDGKARVSRSGYYFPTRRGGAERPVFEPPSAARVAEVLGDLFEILARGAFVHTPHAEDCRFCDMGPACGPDAAVRGKAKIAHAANVVLAPYRRLAGRE